MTHQFESVFQKMAGSRFQEHVPESRVPLLVKTLNEYAREMTKAELAQAMHCTGRQLERALVTARKHKLIQSRDMFPGGKRGNHYALIQLRKQS